MPIAKAEKAVAYRTNAPVRVDLQGDKTVYRVSEAKARWARWKARATNTDPSTPDCVIDTSHQRWRIEQSFPTSPQPTGTGSPSGR